VFEAKQVVARFEKIGDVFAPVLELKQRLPDVKKLAADADEEAEEQISIAAQAEEEPEAVRPRPAKKAPSKTPARRAKRKI
jgi:hypothetical protein